MSLSLGSGEPSQTLWFLCKMPEAVSNLCHSIFTTLSRGLSPYLEGPVPQLWNGDGSGWTRRTLWFVCEDPAGWGAGSRNSVVQDLLWRSVYTLSFLLAVFSDTASLGTFYLGLFNPRDFLSPPSGWRVSLPSKAFFAYQGDTCCQ